MPSLSGLFLGQPRCGLPPLRIWIVRAEGNLLASEGSLSVRNIYEVLRQKEMHSARLRNEIEALRIAIPLLAEEQPEPGAQDQEDESFLTQESTGTDGSTPILVGHIVSRFWKRRRETDK